MFRIDAVEGLHPSDREKVPGPGVRRLLQQRSVSGGVSSHAVVIE
jgi:hypothetical protein